MFINASIAEYLESIPLQAAGKNTYYLLVFVIFIELEWEDIL